MKNTLFYQMSKYYTSNDESSEHSNFIHFLLHEFSVIGSLSLP